MAETEKLDGRREAGQRTRRRLLQAAREPVAARGREGVTLRAITDVAGANVAAVSYHFGSTEELLRAIVEEALESLAQAQVDGLRLLAPGGSETRQITCAEAGDRLSRQLELGDRHELERAQLPRGALGLRIEGTDRFERVAEEIE